MGNWNKSEDGECRSIQGLLPQYIENLLAARTMMEVESHLSHCHYCSQECRQLETTVNLLQAAQKFETKDDFMAKLHSRLDTVVPDTGLHTPYIASLKELIFNLMHARTAPILSAGVAMAVRK